MPEVGATLVESALVLLLVAMGTIALVQMRGVSVLDIFTAVLNSL